MFDRLKTENEQRKVEIHGLKDILVRENDNRIRETEELRMAMELGQKKQSWNVTSMSNLLIIFKGPNNWRRQLRRRKPIANSA